MTQAVKRAQLQVDANGGLLIPPALCRSSGLEPAETVIAQEDSRLVVQTPDTLLARLTALFAGIPPTVSLSDELILWHRLRA